MPKFEFEQSGKKWEVEAPDQQAALNAWKSTQGGQQGGSTMGAIGKGIAQGAGQIAEDIGRVTFPGGPAAFRQVERLPGLRQAKEWIEAPGSTAQNVARMGTSALPAFTPAGPASLLGPISRVGAYPLSRLVLGALAHKILGPVGRHVHNSDLGRLAAQWLAGHVEGYVEDAARGAERLGIGGTLGYKARGSDDKEPRSDTRGPPAKASEPPAGRSREADDRGNRPTAAERFDRRWSALGDLQSAQSEERETR